MVARERGVTVIECMVAFAVLVIATTGIVVHDQGTLRTASESFDTLAATRFAAGHLDARPRATLSAGTRDWDVEDAALPGYVATETVREQEPGLFEVEIRLRDAKGREIAKLTTLMRREEQR